MPTLILMNPESYSSPPIDTLQLLQVGYLEY